MPTTRSQRDGSQRRAGSEDGTAASTRPKTGGATSSEETTSATTQDSCTTTGTGTTTTGTGTTTTETGTTTTGSGAGTSGKKNGTVKPGKPDQTTGTQKSNTTLVPAGSSKKARSTKTTSSATRRRELEAKEELARLELEQARAATGLARTRLELIQYEDEDSTDEDLDDRTAQVQDWIEASMNGEKQKEDSRQKNPKSHEVAKPVASSAPTDIRLLADALKEAFALKEGSTPQPKYIHELPVFDGNSSEWTAFKVVYDDTASVFTDTQNMARLRRAIRGAAREAIKSLLYSDTSPGEVMRALQRRFGRSDALVMAELEKVKTLHKISDNPRDICVFASQINNSVAAIQGLKKPQYLHSPEVMKQILDKLPAILKFRWYDFAAETEDGEFSNLSLMSKFLNKEADRCGAYATMETAKPRVEIMKRAPSRQAAHVTTEDSGRNPHEGEFLKSSNRNEFDTRQRQPTNKEGCMYCQGNHLTFDCFQFKKIPVDDRWAFVKKNRLCFKCLGNWHRKGACRKPGCKTCGRWHHQLLHNEERGPAVETGGTTTSVTSPVNALRTARAYLKMVPVELYGPKGSIKVIALLDEGSTISLLDSQVAVQIGATGKVEELALETVGGQRITKRDSERLRIRVKGVNHNKVRNLNRVHTIDELRLSPQFLDKRTIETYPHLEEIADTLVYDSEPPRLLVGQDNWELIVSREVRKGKPGQPVASLTDLGWVLHGYDAKGVRPVHFINACSHVSQPDKETHDMVKEYFSIDSLGVQPRRPSTDSEGRALNILQTTCKRQEDGRFEAGLLWRSDDETMPESYAAAERRLRSIEKKLEKDSGLRQEYSKQIEHLIASGYAEQIPRGAEQGGTRVWYLPHFPVTHPVKKKIRLVFDAAAKSGGKSLNDALLTGPDLLQSLFGVLIRFRQGPVAVAADIKEMFLQVRIRATDRDSQRFLWRGERRGTPTVYRMTSVMFGAASSPCTAIYVKNRNAADYEREFPEAARAVERNHYMDDYLHSFHDEQTLVNISKQVDFIHRQAGFQLRGWASNRPSLLKEISHETAEGAEISIGDQEERTLGLRWRTGRDSLAFRADLRNTPGDVINNTKAPTKRQVTSAVMSTFDPLGLASPILIQGKKLLQSIWRSGVGWDESIENREHDAWITYVRDVMILKNLEIPRCFSPHSTKGEIHVFVDASELAYAAAVYWRTSTEDGEFDTKLVAGKARVTSLKPVSIPRLELQAALLGCRLACSVTDELDLDVQRRTFWSDSSIVLSWIKTDPRTFKTFVAHRLAEIEDLSQPTEWRWVPTALNPADDATRNVPENFRSDHRWFTGPEFLQHDEHQWPAPRTFKKEPSVEEKDLDIMAATTAIHDVLDPERFSTWKRLWRTVARIIQFIDLCRARRSVNVSQRRELRDPTWGKRTKKIEIKKRNTPTSTSHFIPIEAEQLQRAEAILLSRSQQASFENELLCLSRNKPIEKSSRLKKIDIRLHGNLLRVRGRIDAVRGVATEAKEPVILDSKNRITRLVIEDYHRRFNHANHATVLNELRQKFHILGLRSSLRAIQHSCQWCRVKKATPPVIPEGDLPAERLMHGTPPFTCTGVDYFGPMVVTVGRRHEKRWGALFTCLTTRAVHIELAASLSADSMLMALRRFAARRGTPQTVFSDNGTNFVGANTELKAAWEELRKEDLTCEAEKIGVRWKFIPPGAPNMGGAWERLVRSVKTALNATLRERHPREEVLHTLLLEAEHVVNSRPLTNLADNTEEEALTPNHFLIGRSCGAPRVGAFHDGELVGRESWRTAQRLADHFWQRWLREYLPTLLPRRINGRVSPVDLKVGDVVLVVDQSLPRCTWPRGRITATLPGPDGRTRIVDVATKGGVLRRPSSKVILLVPERTSEQPGESPSQEVGARHKGENVGDQ